MVKTRRCFPKRKRIRKIVDFWNFRYFENKYSLEWWRSLSETVSETSRLFIMVWFNYFAKKDAAYLWSSRVDDRFQWARKQARIFFAVQIDNAVQGRWYLVVWRHKRWRASMKYLTDLLSVAPMYRPNSAGSRSLWKRHLPLASSCENR